MNKLKSQIILPLSGIILFWLLITLTGCDRLIIISGTVYEWVDALENTQSTIYHKEYSAQGLLKEDIQEGIIIEPLSDTHVRCYGEVNNDSFYSNEVTDEKGEFKLVTSLGRRTGEFTTTVEAVRNGFITAKRDLVDNGDSHSLNILLVRKSE